MRPVFLQTAEREDIAKVHIPGTAGDVLPEVVMWQGRAFAQGRFVDGRPGCRIRPAGDEWMPVYCECESVEVPRSPNA